MEKAKIRPLATQKPLNRSSTKLICVIRFWTAPSMQNLVAIDSGVSAPQIRDFVVHFDVTSISLVLGSSESHSLHPLTDF